MAAPTAIPHPENSSHHREHVHTQSHAHTQQQPPRAPPSPPLVSPVYSRTAFSLPGAPMVSPSHHSSFRNTANGWTATGVGSTQPSTSPTSAVKSQSVPQRDTFPERRNSIAANHSRAFSSSSAASLSSSVSSVDSFGGPQTPRTADAPHSATTNTSGAPLGRVHSIPLATSPYEAIKGRRDSWAPQPPQPPLSTSASAASSGGGWTGFGLLRGNRSPPAPDANNDFAGGHDGGGGGMTGLFRKLSIGAGTAPTGAHQGHRHHHHHHHGHGNRSASVSTVETPPAASAPAASDPPAASTSPKTRGRQASVSGATTKRKPSPHGERLLMGWTHAH